MFSFLGMLICIAFFVCSAVEGVQKRRRHRHTLIMQLLEIPADQMTPEEQNAAAFFGDEYLELKELHRTTNPTYQEDCHGTDRFS